MKKRYIRGPYKRGALYRKLRSDGEHAYLEYDVVRLHGIGACERRSAGEQLKHEHAEGPVVGADVVPLVQDHLGRHVLRGAAESPRFATHLKFGVHGISTWAISKIDILSEMIITCSFFANPKSTSFT